MKTKTGCMVGRWNLPRLMAATIAVVLMAGAAHGSTSSGYSPVVTVDTRGSTTGLVAATLLGNGSPLQGGTIVVEGTGLTATSSVAGLCLVSNVPAGAGYVVVAAKCGYGSVRFTNVLVGAGSNFIGSTALPVVNGPYKLIPLVPDVNPRTNSIEEGGIGYRYYVLTASDGRTPVSCGSISVRVAGSAVIPQSGDVSDYWAGRVAGVPDPDGIVRIRIPASALMPLNTERLLEVLESGVVKTTFWAKAVGKAYDRVWMHTVGGHIGGEFIKGGTVTARYSTEVRHEIENGSVARETIERRRLVGASVGAGVGGGVRIGKYGGYAGADVSGEVDVAMSTAYRFDADSNALDQNAMKLYVALGDAMLLAPNPIPTLYEYIGTTYEGAFMQSRLESVGGELNIIGSAGGEIGFGNFGLPGLVELHAWAEGSVSETTTFGFEYSPQAEYKFDKRAGLSGYLEGAVSGGAKVPGLDLEGGLFKGAGAGFTAGVKRSTVTGPVGQIELEQTFLTDGGTTHFVGWGLAEAQAGETLQCTETFGVRLRDSGMFTRLKPLSPIWNLLENSAQGKMSVTMDPSALVSSTLSSVWNDGGLVDYAKSEYRAQHSDINVLDTQIELKAAAGIGLNLGLEGSLERGAEKSFEVGCLWKYKRMPLAAYPGVDVAMIPQTTLLEMEQGWAENAASVVAQALHQVVQQVAEAGETVIEAGVAGAKATLEFGEGVMAAGSTLFSQYVTGSGSGGGGAPAPGPAPGPRPGPPPPDAVLPPLAATNYVYGLGGIYRFASTNAFNGTGVLTIAYSDADAADLHESELRIYQLQDGSNRWALVGGTVNAAGNTVSATITNLGTFAVAPPLPTGDLDLITSTNTLQADGISQMTVLAKNLTLNTGLVATQYWLFTAVADGVTILDNDYDTNRPGVQVISTNAAVTLHLQAPLGGTVGHVSLASVAGDACGSVAINLNDETPPSTPSGLSASAGQSRIWVSWQTNSEPDVAGYRVRYQAGSAGPAWDGTAAVEGTASPVAVAGTNCLLRGLARGTTYYVTVSAVDSTGLESSLAAPIPVTTSEALPAPPRAVAWRADSDGTNVLMWALSEDDGYNDRDVVRYDIYRAVLPGGNSNKVAQVAAGLGIYSETNTPVGAGEYLVYSLVAIDSAGLSSPAASANRVAADGVAIDNDGDGIPDSWLTQYFGHATASAADGSRVQDDPDHDGLVNLQEYQLGLNPLVPDRPWVASAAVTVTGGFVLSMDGLYGRSATLQYSTNLTDWQVLTNFTAVNTRTFVEDASATNSQRRFYRIVAP